MKFIYGISVKEFIVTEKLKSKSKLKNKYILKFLGNSIILMLQFGRNQYF